MTKPALVLTILIILVGSLTFQTRLDFTSRQVLAAQIERDSEIQQLIDLKIHWQQVVADSPTYRDGYTQLALIDDKLGNTREAQVWLQKVLEIDPNYEVPVTLTSLLALPQ